MFNFTVCTRKQVFSSVLSAPHDEFSLSMFIIKESFIPLQKYDLNMKLYKETPQVK